MSKHLPFDNSLASIEDCLDALDHRKDDVFSCFSNSFSPKYSQNTTSSEKPHKCKHDKEISALKHDIEALRHMFIDKSDQLLHIESLFQRALGQFSMEIEGISAKTQKLTQIESKLKEKYSKSSNTHLAPSQGQAGPKNLHRTQGDFSFSNNEGDETSNFSFGQIDENMEVHLPHEKDCKDFEKFLKEQQSSFVSDKILEDHDSFHSPELELDHSVQLNKELIPGALISGKYQIDSIISVKTSSSLLTCSDLTTNIKVCLKVIHRQKELFDSGLDEIKIMNFLSRKLKNLQKFFVKMIEFFYYKENLVIVYENLGESLKFINSNPSHAFWLNEKNIQNIAKQVLTSLASLHEVGVVHGNLTPGSLMLSEKLSRKNLNHFEIKLAKFGSGGVSFSSDEGLRRCLWYSSPEVLNGEKYSDKADIWSLGCLIAELMTGEALLKADTKEEVLRNVRFKQISLFFSYKNKNFCEDSEISSCGFRDFTAGNKVLEDFLKAVMNPKADERLSAQQALAHAYIRKA